MLHKDMFDTERQNQLTEEARKALDKVKKRKKHSDYSSKVQEKKNNVDHTAQLVEEFNDETFEEKLHLDTNVYNVFYEKINDEEVSEEIQQRVAKLLQNVQEIYKHINMEPKIYGFKDMNRDTNDQKLQEEAKRLVNKYLERNYYNVPKDKRGEEYFEGVKYLAREFVTEENMNSDVAVEHAFKTIIIEGLIRSINFPSLAESRAQELMASENYGKYFNQDELIDCWESFEDETRNLARVFAVLV